MKNANYIDINLELKAITNTESAAIAAYAMMGKGDEYQADLLAVTAMRQSLNKMDIQGTIVIGEGERDEAPMLYIGESVGSGRGVEVDIAVDPLEGTSILATGGKDSISAISLAQKGCLLNAPDVYMDKIAVGGIYAEQIIDLDFSVAQNLANIAAAKDVNISDLIVVILDRERHEQLIKDVRSCNARIKLIKDGDLAAIIAASMSNGVDVYMGIGGAPEGVLAASALLTTGGQMCSRLLFRNEDEKTKAKRMGITNLDKKYYLNDLAKGDVIFAATGVTDGSILRGVKAFKDHYITNSISMNSKTNNIRIIETTHKLNYSNNEY
jgi:fructose-1,6-bisphosphatase II / sedoheptulose-1,7-bisphosphatase